MDGSTEAPASAREERLSWQEERLRLRKEVYGRINGRLPHVNDAEASPWDPTAEVARARAESAARSADDARERAAVAVQAVEEARCAELARADAAAEAQARAERVAAEVSEAEAAAAAQLAESEVGRAAEAAQERAAGAARAAESAKAAEAALRSRVRSFHSPCRAGSGSEAGVSPAASPSNEGHRSRSPTLHRRRRETSAN